MQLILASASPRRAELLQQSGINFKICPSAVGEKLNKEAVPRQMVEYLAKRKAADVFKLFPEDLVLGADTLVVLNNLVMGKPASRREAAEMLSSLSGRCHDVYTGIALLSPDGMRINHAVTRVCFKKLFQEEIAEYLASGEADDKAGAYGIQGRAALFVCNINGCYSNVVGLPMFLLGEEIKSLGFDPWKL